LSSDDPGVAAGFGLDVGPVEYIQCLVCGRMTPVDKGYCYHCGAPLPSEVRLPPGLTVCPSCLRVTAVDRGICRRCGAPLPRELVERALRGFRTASPFTARSPWVSVSGNGGVRVLRPGVVSGVVVPGSVGG